MWQAMINLTKKKVQLLTKISIKKKKNNFKIFDYQKKFIIDLILVMTSVWFIIDIDTIKSKRYFTQKFQGLWALDV